MALELAGHTNTLVIMNGKSSYIFVLPEQLTLDQIAFLETIKGQVHDICSQKIYLKTILYSQKKTEYGKNYRDLQVEDMIYSTNYNSYQQLYEEVNQQKQNLQHKSI